MVKNSMPAIHFLADLSNSIALMNGGEQHFYPSGLEMLALNSIAGNGHILNKYGYQGQEHERHFALHLNEFEARHYACPDEGGDPQSARWMVPDPANQFASPYVGMGNAWVRL
jgi:hypothetical protein